MMMNAKKLLKMARKWQQRAALSRKRISFQRSTVTTTCSSTATEKGCFVAYTADKIRFAFPISYLSNSVFFQELLKVSEEEFGLPTGGPITFLEVSHQFDPTANGWRYRKGFDYVNLKC